MGSPDPTLVPVPVSLASVVRAGVKANQEVPGSIALGGTVCALYAQHRLSMDVDFGLPDLDHRFDHIREHLLQLPDWKENRVRPPVLILGSLAGTEIGYRQLRRKTAIETTTLNTTEGPLVAPTLREMIRIKAFLAYERNALRDFIDLAALVSLVGLEAAITSLLDLDSVMTWEKQPQVLAEVIKSLLLCRPRDWTPDAFDSFKWLQPHAGSWHEVEILCKHLGERLANRALLEDPPP